MTFTVQKLLRGESDALGFGRLGDRNSLRYIAELTANPQFPKLHQCSYCSFASTRKETMMVHLRTHTGERPYACLRCLARFGTQGTLYNHMKTHTGEKPFVCSVCSQAFSLKSNPELHVSTHQRKSVH
ncbi:hypothetical protein SK128_016144, partial [Halocaridina rubra]